MTRAKALYDQTDRVLDQWAQAHPDLDLSVKDVTLRIQHLASLIEASSTPNLEQLGLRPGIFTLLAELHRLGPPYTSSPRQLTHHLGMTSGGMTNLLDRAEEENFIRRSPDPLDGRSIIVQLTALGQQTLETGLQLQTQQEQVLLSHLSRREQTTLTQLLRKLMSAAEQLTLG